MKPIRHMAYRPRGFHINAMNVAYCGAVRANNVLFGISRKSVTCAECLRKLGDVIEKRITQSKEIRP